METPPLKSVIPVFLLFLSMLGAWLTYSAIGTIKALQTLGWPHTSGIVLLTEVKRIPSSKGPSKFSPVINYTFKVDSVEYSSDRFSSTGARGTSEWANDVVGEYWVNSAIKVFYNPRNPKESVIDPGLQSDNYWMTILSSFFFAVVLFAFIKQLKQSRNPIKIDS